MPFPGTGDAESICALIRSPETPVLAHLVTVSLVCFIHVDDRLFFWLDLNYGS